MGWILFFTLLGLAWHLWDRQQKARAVAMKAVRQRCEQDQVQLLDDTLVLRRTRPEKRLTQWHWRRDYDFEFSSDGDHRYHGHTVLWGHKVTLIELQAHRPSAEIIPLFGRRRAGE